jgi:hypothetical protein
LIVRCQFHFIIELPCVVYINYELNYFEDEPEVV